MASNLVFAAGLVLLALSTSLPVLFLGWAVIGLGMGIGLYEVGFATLTGIFGKDARGPITGITLIAGFPSTISWPLSGVMLATWGWREACIGWALIHLFISLPLNALLPKGALTAPSAAIGPEGSGPEPSRLAMWLLAFVFAATWFNSTAMAAHLPGLLKEAGASTAIIRPSCRMLHPRRSARHPSAVWLEAVICVADLIVMPATLGNINHGGWCWLLGSKKWPKWLRWIP